MMIKLTKQLILFILILLTIPLTLASTPSFSQTDLIDRDVINGENILGNILFITSPYLPDTYIRQIISQMNFQEKDILRWQGNESVMIKDPVLVETPLIYGSEYKFNTNGIYYITSIANESVSSSILINKSDDNKILITDIVIPNGFNLTFSKYDFLIETENNVELILFVDDDISSGTYDIKYKINEIEYLKEVRVLKTINWSIDLSDLNQTEIIKSGESKYIGKILIENIGNSEIEIRTSKSGNFSNYIGIPNQRTLFKKNTMQLDFEVNVPTIAKSGFYELDLVLNGNDGKIEALIPLNFTVLDSISPVIENISFSTDKAFIDNKINVYANDNNKVTNVSLEFDGAKIWFDKDNNLFTKIIDFDKLSRYKMKFCAYDEAGNSDCELLNKTFEQLEVITDFSESIKSPSVKYGKYSKVKLFNVTNNVDEEFVIRILNIETSFIGELNSTIIFRIINDKGSIKTFSKYDSEIILDRPGEYFLEIRADEEMTITGLIRLELPEHYKEIQDITFSSAFKQYDIPEDFTKSFGETELICEAVDRGDLDKSFIECSRKYSINTRPEDINVIMTVSEKEKIESEIAISEDELRESKIKFGWVITIIIFMFGLLILWSLFKIYWSDYLLFTWGKTKKDSQK